MLGPALRRARARERPWLRSLAALIASLALNALLLWSLAAAGLFAAPRRSERTAVALAPLSPRAWSENRRVGAAPRAPEARAPEPRRGQVIEQPPEQPRSDRPPDDTRYLSDRNARVEHETVSRDAGHYPRLARRAEPGERPERGARVAGRSAPSEVATRPPRRGGAPGDRGPLGAEGLAVPPAPGGERAIGDGRGAAPPAPEPGAGRAPHGGPDLSPSADSLARIAGGPSMDGYRDAEEGAETWLSSREFRFATFLNQMRNAIAEVWYPSVEAAIRERDPEGKGVFYRERTVVLALTLGPAGEVRRLSVAQSSQVPFVDEVALDAVRKAQPFSNPPSAMFGADGEARVPFAFTVFPFDRGGAVRWRPFSR